MKTISLLFLAWLTAGCMLPSDRQQESEIHGLKTENKKLEKEKTNLHIQNKKLKALADRILQRLGYYAKIEKRLIEENHELYSKLYEERVSDQLKREKQRGKDLDELELEAQKLLQGNAHDTQEIVGKLAKMREELLDLKSWQREDEIRFVDITEQLMHSDLPPEKEQQAKREALVLRKNLEQRLERIHKNSAGG